MSDAKAKLIDDVKKTLPSDILLDEISLLFKTLGDKTRAKILFALYQNELRVLDIVAIIEMSQSSVSHQLKTLRQTNLVKARKAGKEVYYSLADEHVIAIFSQVIAHAQEI